LFFEDRIAHSHLLHPLLEALAYKERPAVLHEKLMLVSLSHAHVGRRKKKLDHPSPKKQQQIARSAPASCRAAAPSAAKVPISLSAQVQRLSLGSVQSTRAIKAVSTPARNVASRAASVAAVAEKKPFTKVSEGVYLVKFSS